MFRVQKLNCLQYDSIETSFETPAYNSLAPILSGTRRVTAMRVCRVMPRLQCSSMFHSQKKPANSYDMYRILIPRKSTISLCAPASVFEFTPVIESGFSVACIIDNGKRNVLPAECIHTELPRSSTKNSARIPLLYTMFKVMFE